MFKAQVSNGQQRYDGFNKIMDCQRFGDFGCSKCYNHFWKAVIVDYDLHVTLSFLMGHENGCQVEERSILIPVLQLLILCLSEYMDSPFSSISEHTGVVIRKTGVKNPIDCLEISGGIWELYVMECFFYFFLTTNAPGRENIFRSWKRTVLPTVSSSAVTGTSSL